MTVRFTVKCPKLSQFPAKGISPEDEKTMTKSEILNQQVINNNYNARGKVLGDILISKLNEIDITWCNDGCLVVSCNNTLAEVEQVIADEGLEIQPDRSTIKHKVKPTKMVIRQRNVFDESGKWVYEADGVTPKLEDYEDWIEPEEDIDEVFEPLTEGETKLLLSRAVVNQFKSKIAT